MALVLAVFAGVLTTVAGMGGGQVLLLGLAALYDPATALTATGPALLVGNAHRLWLFRGHASTTAWPFALGAFSGAVLGGLIAGWMPDWALTAMMVGMALLAVAKGLGLRVRVSDRALLPGGLLSGVVSANGGGAGLIAGPLLIAHGLHGGGYIATLAMGAVSLHLGRTLAYGASGWVTTHTLLLGGAMAACIALGNALGKGMRTRITSAWSRRIELGAVGICLALVLLNLT